MRMFSSTPSSSDNQNDLRFFQDFFREDFLSIKKSSPPSPDATTAYSVLAMSIENLTHLQQHSQPSSVTKFFSSMITSASSSSSALWNETQKRTSEAAFKQLHTSGKEERGLLFSIGILYIILIMTSLLSNPLLIYILLWRRKSKIKLIDIFVANLSISDLFLTIFNIPICMIMLFTEEWPLGQLMCQLGTYSTTCSIYVNILTMAYISIDRYFAVTSPLISNPSNQLRKKSIMLDNGTRHKIYSVLTVIWIIALILSLPQFLYTKVKVSEYGSSNADDQQQEQQPSGDNDLLLSALENLTYTTRQHHSRTTRTATTPSIMEEENAEINSLLNDQLMPNENSKPYHDPMRCIIDYPLPQMKNYMVLINFLLQYLIPSIVILYFYGKIIYHLYLNLNVEELMDSPAATAASSTTSNGSGRRHHNQSILSRRFFGRQRFKSKSSNDLATNNNLINHPHPHPHPHPHHHIDEKSVLSLKFISRKKRDSSDSKSTTSINNAAAAASNNKEAGIVNCCTEKLLMKSTTSFEHTVSPQLVRKRSRMRIEGANRTKNLKKSIKVMIIIIALFLLSWLPIHLYRLVTTYYISIASFIEYSFGIFNLNKNNNINSSSNNNSNKHGNSNFSSAISNSSCDLMNYSGNKLNTTAAGQNPMTECIINGINSLGDTAEKLEPLHNSYVFFFCYFLSMSSVCYNPIVYFWMHKKFRQEVKQLFSRVFNIAFTIKRSAAASNILTTSVADNNTHGGSTRNKSLIGSSRRNTATTTTTTTARVSNHPSSITSTSIRSSYGKNNTFQQQNSRRTNRSSQSSATGSRSHQTVHFKQLNNNNNNNYNETESLNASSDIFAEVNNNLNKNHNVVVSTIYESDSHSVVSTTTTNNNNKNEEVPSNPAALSLDINNHQ